MNRAMTFTTGFTTGLAAVLALYLPSPLLAQGTTDTKRINIKALNLHAPIQVLAVATGGHTFTLPRGPKQFVDIPISSSPHWIANLSLIVENYSPKNIVAIEAKAYIPDWEADPERPQQSARFHEGQLPEHALHDANGQSIAEESTLKLNVGPGATATIPLGRAYEKLLQRRQSQNTSPDDAQAIWVQIERIYFSDGTAWAFNSYLKPDTLTPGKYTNITPDEWKSLRDQ